MAESALSRTGAIVGATLVAALACAAEDQAGAPSADTPADTTPSAEATTPADTPVDTTDAGDTAALAPDTAAGAPDASDAAIVESFRQRVPGDVLVRRGACPFECCVYRDWEATGEIPVVAEERGTAPPIFSIGAGERFRADSGNVHVTSIAVVPVTDSVGDPPYWSFAPGDTVVVLDYIGEGFYNLWHDGEVVEAPTFWTDGPITSGDGSIGTHATEWWVHVTMPDGRTGWIRADTAPQITGADACG